MVWILPCRKSAKTRFRVMCLSHHSVQANEKISCVLNSRSIASRSKSVALELKENRCFSAIVFYQPLHKFWEKWIWSFWFSDFFYVLLNFEPGVVPAAEYYFELFRNSYFTDVPTLIGDLKTFFSFQIEHLTLTFTWLFQCYTVLS